MTCEGFLGEETTVGTAHANHGRTGAIDCDHEDAERGLDRGDRKAIAILHFDCNRAGPRHTIDTAGVPTVTASTGFSEEEDLIWVQVGPLERRLEPAGASGARGDLPAQRVAAKELNLAVRERILLAIFLVWHP